MICLIKSNIRNIILILSILFFSNHAYSLSELFSVEIDENISEVKTKDLKKLKTIDMERLLFGAAILGFYENVLYIYFSIILINLIFFKISYKINFKNLYLFSCSAALIFYFISNFSVWATGTLYEKNFAGLINCYYLALPFLKNTLISTLFYSYLGLFIFKPKYKFNFTSNI